MQFDCAVMSSAIMTLEDAATRAVENPDKPITPLTRAMPDSFSVDAKNSHVQLMGISQPACNA